MYEIDKADEDDIQSVLNIVSKSPEENIILIADLTQLREWCDVRVAKDDDDEIVGIFALYKDLDFLAGAFWVVTSEVLEDLMQSYGNVLKETEMVLICTSNQIQMLRQIGAEVEAIQERQMIMEDPSQLKCREFTETYRLTSEDTDDLREIYKLSGTPAWTPNALNLGPFFGVRNDEERIIAVAGVHFVSKYGAEIGNIATHPEFRRKGYAQCCVAAVTREVLRESERVVLHFFSDNLPAQSLYEKMGFIYSSADPVYFTKVTLK